MGAEDFYLNVKTDSKHFEGIKNIIYGSELYSSTLDCSFYDDEKEFCLQAALVSFYPMCEVLYNLLSEISSVYTIDCIETLKITRLFDFTDAFDFVKWMREHWQWKIEHFNKAWGIFSVKPSKYYDARRKLRKKYFHNVDSPKK